MERQLNTRPLKQAISVVFLTLASVGIVSAGLQKQETQDKCAIVTEGLAHFNRIGAALTGTWTNNQGDVTGFGITEDTDAFPSINCALQQIQEAANQ